MRGQTPLLAAARYGCEGVVRLLIEHHNVDPDIPDRNGQTPLWWATENGHAGVVALLQFPTPPTSHTA